MESSPSNAVFDVYLLGRQPVGKLSRVLESIPVLTVHRVSSASELRAQVQSRSGHAWDGAAMLVLDHWSEPQTLIEELRGAVPDVPLIAIAPAAREDLGLAALRWGAHDYLLGEQMTAELVARTLRCARQLCRLQRHIASLDARLDDSHQRLRDLVLDIARHRQQSLEREARWILNPPPSPVRPAPADAARALSPAT